MGLKPAVRSPRHEYCRRGAAKCCPSRCQEGAMPRTMAMDLTIDAIDSTHRKHEFPPPPGFSEQHYIGHEQDPRAVAKKVDQTQLKIKVCDVGTLPPTSLKSLTLLPSPLACLLAAHGPTHPDTRNAACHPTHAMPRVDAPCPLSHPPRGPAEGGSQRVSPTHRLSLSLSLLLAESQGAGAPARSIVYDDWLHALDEWERGAHLQHHDHLLRDLQSDQVGHRRQQRIRPIRRHKDGRRGAHQARLTPVSHQSHTSLTPVSHQSHTSLTPVSHKPHTSLTPVSHKSHTSLTQVSHSHVCPCATRHSSYTCHRILPFGAASSSPSWSMSSSTSSQCWAPSTRCL